MKSVILWLEKNKIQYKKTPMQYGITAYTIYCNSIDHWEAVAAYLRSKKGVKVVTHLHTLSIRIFNRDEWETLQRRVENVNTLANIFYLALRDGKTQEEAKEQQRIYSELNGMQDEYNGIYA